MKIVELNKNEYKGYELEYEYTTRFHYAVIIKKKKNIVISIKKKKMRKTEKKFTDHLFAEYIENPRAFAIFEKKKMIGVIEGSLESWNKRYRIWNFIVDKRYRKEGYGKELFKYMVELAKKEDARAIVLEVQSCNEGAIGFYMSQGLHFVGMDTMSYTNNDIEEKEVRLEFGMRLK
ncbi:MAG: GNAT family N-acetyltransferase [Acholeplasmataceae bacterium]|nr:GNAT family N-acetyltransferase [Acholeplasmataceae bacterium]